jgi:ParB family chromosome partitioning protein
MLGAQIIVGRFEPGQRADTTGHAAENGRSDNEFQPDGAPPMTPPNWQKIQSLPISDIQVEERLRTASAPAVASIVSSIHEVGGILQPLLVRRIKGGYRLMDGLHRLTAAKEAGLEEVPVQVTECTNDEAIRIEVDANVAGAPLTPLDMAVFLAEHKKLYELDNPEAKRGSAGGRAKNGVLTDIMSVSSFAANAAEVFDKTDRHIRRLISVGEQLSREEIAHLRNAPNRVQFKDLEHIAKCSEQADRSEICAALGSGEAKSAKEVLNRKKAPGQPTQSTPDMQAEKLSEAFDRASKAARMDFVRKHLDVLAALLAEAEAQEATGEVVPFSSQREG